MAFTYSKLASTTVGASGTSAITFSNIPQNYTDLVLKVSLRQDAATNAPGGYISFNGTTLNYTGRQLTGSGSVASSTTNTNGFIGDTDGASDTANTFSNQEIYIPNYAGTANKSFSIDSVMENNATGASAILIADLWSSVTAISSITLYCSSTRKYVQYSTATLYGIRVEI